ncbi:aromatic ring-hydroxylating oxygenase subunit alpha [Lacipirellula limnantheis]|uniref:Anthranilate 1,2-dioxygenase large subunit n=1 Tax=Lacipirellula limnantheis TaxID=2528024 RepID=A0A517U0L5_9BACT|nr:aromatic ring-hydroxylating dioxygenase subunit alpha [Lacipirellula limnantheis]QDT74153.1 Anthranilate 1,2-dioxygenase large subunit [Lacipirellula limnantheis]
MSVSSSPASLTAAERQTVRELAARRKPGYTMPGELYGNPLVYRAELEQIWRRGWLFVGHTCEIPTAGDYFTFDLDKDSLIVIRNDDGAVNALWNVCRHRGTLMCSESQGRVGRLVCPYHQWAYARDGALVSCRGMHDEIDKSQLGLLKAHCRELEGMIFVSLADEPLDFDVAAEAIAPLLRPQGFNRAKVAKTVDYMVAANWKIVWENNRECYHCNVNHPQYIKANFDHYNADDTSHRIQAKIEQAVAHSEEKWSSAGLAVSHRRTGMTEFPGMGPHGWFAANRTPLVEGFVSETLDGRQVAPLMGDYADPDVGTLRIRTLPNMWNHSSCDHGVSTRLLPMGIDRTAVRVTWLVHQDAVEGKDYKLEDIMPFWQMTSEQDWELCVAAQKGVSSSHYVPGPFSTYKEYNVDAFVTWCLAHLSSSGEPGA